MKKQIILTALIVASFQWGHAQDFITRNGNKLTEGAGGPEIYLRGMCFGNEVWDNVVIPSNHHKEVDFARVRKMGMNVIRFYMNYLTFEADASPYTYKPQGFAWLDTNIVWARKHGIYLILNIHVPQGGYQSNCGGNNLWKIPSNQDRLVALWKAIAQRYANEAQIAGFDLLNEPEPTDSIAQWTRLEQRIIDSVRKVDNNHLIFSEKNIALNCDYSKTDFNRLNEEKLVYSIHTYDPYEYTTQLQDWAGTGDGGKYPDESVIAAPADLAWATGQYNNLKLPTGNSAWRLYKGAPFSVDSDTLIIGKPVFYGHNLNKGKAYYDEIVVNEVDVKGNIVQQVASLDIKDLTSLAYWSSNGSGKMQLEHTGPHDSTSFSITGTTDYATVTAYTHIFKVQKGKRYTASGWMKGDSIPTGTTCSIAMEFYYSPSGQPAYGRDYEYLKNQVLAFSKFPREQGYPIYYGEFGVVREAFQNGKGGELWVADMIRIFDSLDIHWTYHVYRESGFGLYDGVSGNVDTTTVTESLKETFEKYFGIISGLEDDQLEVASLSRIYPNPFKTTFSLENTSGKELLLEVMDGMGRKVQEQQVGPQSTVLMGESFSPGMYYLRLQGSTQSTSYKLLKE